jgi:ribose transport system ATP-binding protein
VVALAASGLAAGTARDGLSFEVREGEILGVAGLVGSGRTEMAEVLCGLRPGRGEVRLHGERLARKDALRRGVAYLSEDRRESGLLLRMSVTANLTLAALSRFGKVFTDRKAERAAAARHRDALAIKAPRGCARQSRP